MIVMKFGGSSLESSEAIRRAVQIIEDQLAARPVVVVSALGKTTDSLLRIAEEAGHGHSYLAWKGVKELWEYHSDVAAGCVKGAELNALEDSLQKHCTALHRLLLSMEDEGRELTPALQDEIASFGERMSSEVMSAALSTAGIPSVALDSRQFITTDDQHTHAKPLLCESYAKVRRAIPRASESRTVVMGGFIGATEAGVTTTLGRGGSDLTASLVGAALNVEEIQIWTDVDGLLTCDPRLMDHGYRLTSVSYREAAAAAVAGAKVLHPDTVAPAVRLRIPVVIRNSRRPHVEGTRIVAKVDACRNPVKTMACRRNVTVLEMRPQGDSASFLDSVLQRSTELIAKSADTVYLAVNDIERFRDLSVEIDGCVEVQLRPESAIITLVGDGIAKCAELPARIAGALKHTQALLLSDEGSPLMMFIVIPSQDLRKSLEALHAMLFAQADERFFVETQLQQAPATSAPAVASTPEPRRAARRQPGLALA